MADVRMLVSWGTGAKPTEDWFSNTLYFSVDGGVGQGPDYQALANDLVAIYGQRTWCNGCRIEVRAYDLADAKPRPERAFATTSRPFAFPDGTPQVALALSYYSGRNLPRNRGRIYTGPYATPARRPTQAHRDDLIAFAQALAGLGGLNVDWSVYSPTTAAGGGDGTKSISTAWVDDSWDIIRRRKILATSRSTVDVNE